MRLLDYLIYRLRPFGLVEQRPATPEPPPDLELTAKPWIAPNETLVNTTETEVGNDIPNIMNPQNFTIITSFADLAKLNAKFHGNDSINTNELSDTIGMLLNQMEQ